MAETYSLIHTFIHSFVCLFVCLKSLNMCTENVLKKPCEILNVYKSVAKKVCGFSSTIIVMC